MHYTAAHRSKRPFLCKAEPEEEEHSFSVLLKAVNGWTCKAVLVLYLWMGIVDAAQDIWSIPCPAFRLGLGVRRLCHRRRGRRRYCCRSWRRCGARSSLPSLLEVLQQPKDTLASVSE